MRIQKYTRLGLDFNLLELKEPWGLIASTFRHLFPPFNDWPDRRSSAQWHHSFSHEECVEETTRSLRLMLRVRVIPLGQADGWVRWSRREVPRRHTACQGRDPLARLVQVRYRAINGLSAVSPAESRRSCDTFNQYSYVWSAGSDCFHLGERSGSDPRKRLSARSES